MYLVAVVSLIVLPQIFSVQLPSSAFCHCRCVGEQTDQPFSSVSFHKQFHNLKTDRIPNGFIAVGILAGLAGSQPYGPGLSHSVISMFLAFLLMYPLFKIGTLGAGDIKVLIMTPLL